MANFNTAFLDVVIAHEGKYSIDKNDAGGETIWGLTRRDDADWTGWNTVAQFRGKPNYPNNLPFETLKTEAAAYYRKKYWDFAQLDKFPSQELATKVFDIAVNMGNKTAITMLQRALNALNHGGKDYPNLVVDGIFGQKTLDNVMKCNAANVLTAVKSLQGARYVEITENKSSQKDFANGWMGRV